LYPWYNLTLTAKEAIFLVLRSRNPILLLLLLVTVLGSASAQDKDYFVYYGTYTGFRYVRHSKTQGVGESHSKGIYMSRFNASTGKLSEPQLAAEITNPSFLATTPDHRFLYAVTEDPLSLGPPLDHASFVSAYAIDAATGKLTLLNTLPTGGTSTCFISTDKTGKYVLMANFGSGSVSVIRTKEDGSLGETTSFIQNLGHSVNPFIQTAPHPHSILASPDNRYVIVSDLGLDKILIFHFDEKTGQLTPTDPQFATIKPGGGPRHFTFTPSGKFGYQVSEMSGIVDAFAWDPSSGMLNHVQSYETVPAGMKIENHSAEIAVSPDGKFLYESNRRNTSDGGFGPDTIGIYAIDADKGTLTPVDAPSSGAIMPRNFAIDPTGSFLLVAHQYSNNVLVFKINAASGKLTKTGDEVKLDVPVCIVFVPAHS
jgi:6-phosphogluconolactonase